MKPKIEAELCIVSSNPLTVKIRQILDATSTLNVKLSQKLFSRKWESNRYPLRSWSTHSQFQPIFNLTILNLKIKFINLSMDSPENIAIIYLNILFLLTKIRIQAHKAVAFSTAHTARLAVIRLRGVDPCFQRCLCSRTGSKVPVCPSAERP